MNTTSIPHWDLVGDLHGEARELERLLHRLGYLGGDGRPETPVGRRLLFLGDYIDRGPDSRAVLGLVRRLVEEGTALAIMGNHEYNFIAYHSFDDNGNRLRLDTKGHRAQIAETLASFRGHEEEIPGWIEWMKSLPLFLDLGGFRAVHASWVPADIAYLEGRSLRDHDFLVESARHGSRAWHAIGRVLKGVELEMPDGIRVPDSNGIPRGNMRVRWWGDLKGLSWSEAAFPVPADLPSREADWGDLGDLLSYGPGEPPVFFGHYKVKGRRPMPQSANVACLDYGLGHGGPATAYRWSGERCLSAAKFLQTGAYEVFIDDNFGYQDESERISAGIFATYEAALEVARKLVRESVQANFSAGLSAADLIERYRDFGADPFIVPTPVGTPMFSAWTYAEEVAREIAGPETLRGASSTR